MVFDRLLGAEGRLKEIDAREVLACGRREGFLESVAELVDSAINERETDRGSPPALCYFYNGAHHQLTLAQVTKVPSESVKVALRDEPHDYVRTYQNLVLARFENFDQTTKRKTEFELLLGTTGSLRGVPVQIHYQPNWWFQVILNLKTPENPTSAQNH